MTDELEFNIKVKKHQALDNVGKNAFFIEGGGTKGIYAIGLLKYLFGENPYLSIDSIDIFGGTSVGSFFATALSLGYQCDDFTAISKKLDLSELIDSKYLFMLTFYRFVSHGHLYNSVGRRNIIIKILSHGIDNIKAHLGKEHDTLFGPCDLTFGHLRKLIDTYPSIYKHLIINAVDINRSMEIFMTTLNDKWDNIKLVDAIMASSAIPFVFKYFDLYYYPDSDTYGYESTKNSEIVRIVDGGISTNNPIDYFLLNEMQYSNYTLWLLKFSSEPKYVKIDSIFSFLEQLALYLIDGKNNIKTDLIEEEYQINWIKLHSNASILEIYSAKQIQQITEKIYQECVDGKLHFVS